MEQEARKLVSRIRQNQRVERDALALSLSTPTALGWSLPEKDDQKLRQEVTALWTSAGKPEDFGRLLKDWQTKVSDSLLKHLIRVRIVALLLNDARRSKAVDFRACFASDPAASTMNCRRGGRRKPTLP